MREQSPYLLQHAYNPVDWYPWGPEAFDRARRDKKLIFLSIGYSTCHWCHVMERESFSDEEIAQILNNSFVSIKLDREERPEVDNIYMTAVQALTGQGGWPLNVFLTPDLKPFYGGTYFPPRPRFGQPGFRSVLERIADLWRTRRDELILDAGRVSEAISSLARPRAGGETLDAGWLDQAYQYYRANFDRDCAGFGGAPKFPMPVNHNFLLRVSTRALSAEGLEMSLKTLRAMAAGGICDQLGGGFHRYSTDGQWRLPHFEKMLYDNAQLAVNYLEAFVVDGGADLALVAREILGYVLREMTHAEGGFYSAQDADSAPTPGAQNVEGAYYVWSEEEIRRALGDDADLFVFRYGVSSAGQDVLYQANSIAETATRFNLTAEDARCRLSAARGRLLSLRSSRPSPGLDDKILTSWNGLMISAFAKGFQILGDAAYLEAAARCAGFIKANLYDTASGRLWHRWRAGQAAVPGIADDSAFLIQGLIDLFEASFDPAWLRWAVELAGKLQELFGDGPGGVFMTAQDHDENLLVRIMEDTDNVEPCASSAAALGWLRLAQYVQREDFRELARKTIERFGPLVRDRPFALPQMLTAVDFMLSRPRQIVIAGDPAAAQTQAMLEAVSSRLIAQRAVVLVAEHNRAELHELLPWLKELKSIKGKPTAYICVDYACRLPVHDAEALKKLL